MKAIYKMLAATAVLFGSTLTASAQYENSKYANREETRDYPNFFIGVQGGAQAIINGYKFGDVITPIGAVQGGIWISPSFGTRLQISGWKGREGWEEGYGTYNYKYAAAGLDVMVNLTNAFSKTDKHAFNVILFGGLGANKAWGTEYRDLTYNPEDGTEAQDYFTYMNYAEGAHTHNHAAFETRAGLIFDLAINNRWHVNLEGGINHIGSRGDIHQFNGAKEWQVDALFGISFHFGKKAKKSSTSSALASQDYDNARNTASAVASAPVVKEEPAPKPAPKKKESVQKEIFFMISQSTPSGAEATKVSDVANWLKAHPSAKATIKGYADKGTGTAEVNQRVSRERAEKVAKQLTDDYGIDASRLTVTAYGDTVQPYADNDSNRVVIVVGQEQ